MRERERDMFVFRARRLNDKMGIEFVLQSIKCYVAFKFGATCYDR
jgi:hypothetical protein